MKDQKGITLISLIIYVILITLVVAGVSLLTSSFYKNVREFDNESDNVVSYTKFNMHFLNDIKEDKILIDEYQDNYIILVNEKDLGDVSIQYSIQNGALYRNKVKICDDIQDGKFSVDLPNDTITVYLKIGNYEKTTTYVIEKIKEQIIL